MDNEDFRSCDRSIREKKSLKWCANVSPCLHNKYTSVYYQHSFSVDWSNVCEKNEIFELSDLFWIHSLAFLLVFNIHSCLLISFLVGGLMKVILKVSKLQPRSTKTVSVAGTYSTK